jgi:AcrR family transcriptional regulator
MTAFAHRPPPKLDTLTETPPPPGGEDQARRKTLLGGKPRIALPLPPARPRTGFSRHAKRRAQARQAALALFAERGVAQTSLARIAWKMELSPAALRTLYPDKAALLAELLEAHLTALAEAAESAAPAEQATPRARLTAMVAACLKFLAGEGAAVQRIFASAFAGLDEAGKAAVKAKRSALEARFAAAIAPLLPAAPAPLPAMLARALLTIVESTASGCAPADGGNTTASAQAAVAGILAMAAPGPEPGAEGPAPPPDSGPQTPSAPTTTPPAAAPGPGPRAGTAAQVEGALAKQTLGDLGHMPALKFDNPKLIGRDRAATIAPGNRSAAVGRATGHFIDHHQPLLRIGDANDDHAVMQKRDVERQNRTFLPAVLSRGRSEHAAELANQLALCPERPGLVEEIAHLRSHVTKPGRCAENNGVILRKLLNGCDRCSLIQLGPRLFRDLRRHNLRHTLDGNRRARNRTRPLRNSLRKLFHPAIHRVVEHQNFAHRLSFPISDLFQLP